MRGKSLSRVQLFVTPWPVARQAPLSTGFSRQGHEWVAIPISRGSSPLRGQAWGSGRAGGFFTVGPYCPHVRHPRPLAPQSRAADVSPRGQRGRALGCGHSSPPGPLHPAPELGSPPGPSGHVACASEHTPSHTLGAACENTHCPAGAAPTGRAGPGQAECRAPRGEALVGAQSPSSWGQVLAG